MSTRTTTAQRLMLGYSVLATTLLAAFVLSQAIGKQQHAQTKFEEIDVQRINVIEPDGTLRMTISNSSAAPGMIVRGRERPHPAGRKAAGILFFNDEGTENGGLIFGGAKQNGRIASHGHLSFDQYEQDQVISLDQGEEEGRRSAGLTFSDRPDAPIPWDLLDRENTPAGKAEIAKLEQNGGFGYTRLFIGKTEDRASNIILKDAKGRARLFFRVAPDGAAAIEFLDENGKPVRSITAEKKE
jgi:hypothetical protein